MQDNTAKSQTTVRASDIKEWCITLRFDGTKSEADDVLEKAYSLVAGFGSVASLKLEDHDGQ